MINVARVVTSPMLAQTVQVQRTGKGAWVDGVYTPGESGTLSFKGIVTQASSRDMEQVPEGDRQKGTIRVLSTVPLYITGEAGSNLSDIVVYRGERYKVQSVTHDGDYGFYRAICTRLAKEVG